MKLNPYLKLCSTRVACALLWLGLVKMQESIFTGPWASDRSSKEKRTCFLCVSVSCCSKPASKLSCSLFQRGHSAQVTWSGS